MQKVKKFGHDLEGLAVPAGSVASALAPLGVVLAAPFGLVLAVPPLAFDFAPARLAAGPAGARFDMNKESD